MCSTDVYITSIMFLQLKPDIASLILKLLYLDQTYVSPITSVWAGLKGCNFDITSFISVPGFPKTVAFLPDTFSIIERKPPGPVGKNSSFIFLYNKLL